MRDSKLSRRDMLRASTVLAAGAVFAEPLAATAPEPTPLSPALIQAARKEGTLAFYTAMDIPVAEGLSKAFEAKYPGIKVRVKRSGAERVFQRIGKEEEIRIHEVDVVCSTDAGHFVRWRRDGLLAPFLSEDAARHLPAEQIGADGMYATAFASLSPIGYNTNLVKPEDAPTTFADLLDPKWQGKIVKEIRTIAAPSSPRHLRSRAIWAVLFREARPAEGRAGAVIAGSAEPARPRRKCRASRRCSIRTPAVARTWCAGGSRLCWRGHATHHRSQCRL